MIKSALIQKIAAANQHLYHRDIERIVNVVFNEIVEALARGDRVELRDWRLHGQASRAARVVRNPRTGAAVSVAEKFVPFFKTGKDLRKRLNGNKPQSPAIRLTADGRLAPVADPVPEPGRMMAARVSDPGHDLG